jgi:hypothetical protein
MVEQLPSIHFDDIPMEEARRMGVHHCARVDRRSSTASYRSRSLLRIVPSFSCFRRLVRPVSWI